MDNVVDFVEWKRKNTYPKVAEDRFFEVYDANRCPDCGTDLFVGNLEVEDKPDYLYCPACSWAETKEWNSPPST